MPQQNPYMYYNPTYTQPQYNPNPYQYQQPQQPMPTTQTAWVQGEAAARAYQLNPGEKVFFMDSEEPYLYAREADATGKPLPMVKYKLVKVEEKTGEDLSQYVKVTDLNQMIATAVEEEVNRRMSEITLKPTTRKKAEE